MKSCLSSRTNTKDTILLVDSKDKYSFEYQVRKAENWKMKIVVHKLQPSFVGNIVVIV